MSDSAQTQGFASTLSRRQLLAYGCLGFPVAVLGYPLGLFLHPYYADELGLGLAAISTVLLVSRLVDFATDPLIGWLSDHTRSPFGRRKPYMVLGLPVMLTGIWMLFTPEAPVTIWYMLFWNTFMYLGWTIMILPYYALGAEISNNYMVRAQITASRQLFVIAGLIGVSALIWFFQSVLDRDSPGEVLNLLATFLFFVFPVALVVVLFTIKEPPPTPVARRQSWLKGLRSMLRIGPFRRLVYVAIAIVIGEASRHAVLVFFMQDVLQAGGRIGQAYTAYYLFGAMAIPLWQWLAKRVGKHRSLAIAMINSAVMVLFTGFCGPEDYNIFLVLFVLKGLSFGAFAYLPVAMIADIVDVDTAVTRQSRAGMFLAVNAAIDKIGIAIGMFLALQLLGLSGYDPQLPMTTAGEWMLRAEYAFLPSFFFLLASYLVWNYPLTSARHANIVAALGRREQWEQRQKSTTNPSDGAPAAV